MVRVAGVMEQIYSKYTKPDDSGLTPQELMAQLSEKSTPLRKSSTAACTAPFCRR